MLLMRRREEAEGDRRMMGSGRRPGFLSRETREVVVVVEGAVLVLEDFFRSLKNVSEYLRTWEKSYRATISFLRSLLKISNYSQ